jgi:hypothetical protein
VKQHAAVLVLSGLLAVAGCSSEPTPMSPSQSTSAASSPVTPAPPEGTVHPARPVSVATADGITYLTHAGADSDAREHLVTFYVDDAGCLRVQTDDPRRAEVPVLNERYAVTSTGISLNGEMVAEFGEPTSSTLTGRGDVPAAFFERCGQFADESILGFSSFE